jgi:hypothetical protein
MIEALVVRVSRETAGDGISTGDQRVVAYLFVHAGSGRLSESAVRVEDLPDTRDPEPIRACIRIRQMVERVKPVSLGIAWPVMETETRGVIYFLCRNIWGESSIQAFLLDVDNGVIFEPAKIDNVATRFLSEFLKLYMAWSGLSQLRDLPGINEWAHECIAAADDDPCPCGSKLDYEQCCARYEFTPLRIR